MPETCTCGAVLVEDARFCHRCGRPVFPEDRPSFEPPPAVEPVSPRPPRVTLAEPARVGFSNPVALRVAFLMSIAIMVVDMIPFVQMLFLLWWLIAGWGAVRLYRRITGYLLSPASGARLGSLTGVLTFLSLTVVSALTMLFNGRDVIQAMIRQNPQFSQVANNPAALAIGFLFVMVVVFAIVVGTCAAGGALSARLAANSTSGK